MHEEQTIKQQPSLQASGHSGLWLDLSSSLLCITLALHTDNDWLDVLELLNLLRAINISRGALVPQNFGT